MQFKPKKHQGGQRIGLIGEGVFRFDTAVCWQIDSLGSSDGVGGYGCISDWIPTGSVLGAARAFRFAECKSSRGEE